MFVSKELCPVPFDQQPLNEYVSLKKSCFFSWSVLGFNQYLNTIGIIFTILFIFFTPFVFLVSSSQMGWLQLIIINISIVTFVFVIIFIRLYLGWSYIIKRLVSATVFYEESGWYDGQIWIKTVEIMTKDRLIGLYELAPFIRRIKYSLFTSIALFILENITFDLF